MANARVDILLALRSQLTGAEGVLGQLGKMHALLAGVAASAPVLAIKGAGDLAQEIKSIAGQAGISTTALQVLEGQMSADAVKVETLNQALITLRRNLQDAKASAASPMNEALRALRLDAAGLQALEPEAQLEVIGRRLSAASDKNAAFNAALDLLGTKNAPKLLESLRRLGTEGFENWERLQKSLTLSPEQLERLDKAGNYLERMERALKLAGAGVIADAGGFVDNARANPGATLRAISDAADKAGPRFGGSLGGLLPFGGINPLWFISGNLHAAGTRLERAQAASEDPMHGRAFTPESIASALRQKNDEAKMAAAALAATMTEIDASTKAREIEFGKRSGAMLADIAKKVEGAAERSEGELDRLAEKFRELGDTSLPYKKQLEEIAQLQRLGKLTADEAAAATARLNREMNRELETMLEKGNAALAAFGTDRARMEANPFLTNREKAAERIRFLEAENRQIEELVRNLERMAGLPGVDPAQLSGQIRGLRDRQTGNTLEAGRSRELGGAGENVRASLTRLQDEFGTVGENIGDTFSGAIRNGMGAAEEQLQLLIGGTDYWSERLGVIGGPIMGGITAGISKMFTEWIAQRAIVAAKELIFGQQEAAAKAPGAMLTSISSYGTAALVGVGAFLAAMAAASAFADGGIVRGPGGPRDDRIFARLSNGEGVLNARATAALGEDFINALNFSADPVAALAAAPVAAAAGSSGAGGAFAGAGKPTRVIVVDGRDRAGLARLTADPRFRNVVQDIANTREV